MAEEAGVTLLAALDEGGIIGRDGQLPWRLPADLKRFRRLTLGRRVLMGRRTFDSLGKPLDQRENWVVTRDPAWSREGVRRFASVADALDAGKGAPLLVIGGATVYAQALSAAVALELTRVHASVPGDTRFPDVDWSQWRETGREDHPADATHAYAFSFVRLERDAPR